MSFSGAVFGPVETAASALLSITRPRPSTKVMVSMVSEVANSTSRSKCLVTAYGVVASGWYSKRMVTLLLPCSYGLVIVTARPNVS